MDAVIRKSVPLDSALAALTDSIKVIDSPERLALEDVVGRLPANLSEAQILALLLKLGSEVVFEAKQYVDYSALAASRNNEDEAFEKAVRARRVNRQSRVEPSRVEQ